MSAILSLVGKDGASVVGFRAGMLLQSRLIVQADVAYRIVG